MRRYSYFAWHRAPGTMLQTYDDTTIKYELLHILKVCFSIYMFVFVRTLYCNFTWRPVRHPMGRPTGRPVGTRRLRGTSHSSDGYHALFRRILRDIRTDA